LFLAGCLEVGQLEALRYSVGNGHGPTIRVEGQEEWRLGS